MTSVVQVEFEDCLQDTIATQNGRNLFCAAVSFALNVTVLCDTLIPHNQGNLLLAGIQFQVVGPVDVYGDAPGNVNAALTAANFFTSAYSFVTNVALYYHPDALVIGLSIGQFLVMCMLICLVYVAHFPKEVKIVHGSEKQFV